MRRMVMLSILWALMTLGPSAFSSGADGQATLPGTDRLTITIDDPSQEAVVNTSEKADVVFHGNVTVDGIRGERIIVTLTPQVNQGWPCSIDPSTMTIRDNAPNPIVMKVTVPENSLAAHAGILTVEGVARGGGLTTTANATAIITIRPYYRVMIETEGGAKNEVSVGTAAEFNLRIWNYGNAVDNITLEIVDLKGLRDKGWEIRFNVTVIEKVDVSDKGLVKLTAIPPRDLAPYKNEPTIITVKAESRGASSQGGAMSQSVNVTVHQKGFNATGVTVVIMVIAAIISGLVFVLRKRRMRRARLSTKDAGGPTG